MRKKILFPVLLVAVLSIFVMASTGTENIYPHIVNFKDGTTYEEAAQAIPPFSHPQDIIAFHWSHPHGIFEGVGWNSGITYNSNQSILKVRSEHWRHYYNLVLFDIKTATEMISSNQVEGSAKVPPHPTLAKHLEWSQQEKNRLDATVFECWNDDSCPSVPVTHTNMVIFTTQTLSAIQALPIVESVQIPNP